MFCFLGSHAINLWNLSSRTFSYRYWTLHWTATWLQGPHFESLPKATANKRKVLSNSAVPMKLLLRCFFFVFFVHIKRFLWRRTNGSHRTNGDTQHSILRDASKPLTWASRWRRESTDELSTQPRRCWSYSSGQIHWNLTALSSAVPQIPRVKAAINPSVPRCHCLKKESWRWGHF